MGKLKVIMQSAGPGVVTGAADDDPSGIATYTMTGARFGQAFLWTALLTWPMMATVQIACAKIAMATGQGLAAALLKKFPRWVMMGICGALFFANTLNVGADLSAMADCAELLTGISSHIFVVLFGVVISVATVRLSYAHISSVLKWLALSLGAYIIAAILERPDWWEVFLSSWQIRVPGGREGWATLVAILGTTISPYLFFWQASQEVEEKKHRGAITIRERRITSEEQVLEREIDVTVGTLFSNVVMFFIMLSASLTLHNHGIFEVNSSKEAAIALAPIAGRFTALLYSLGLLGVGFLAIPTLTGSAAYACAETFRWRQGLDMDWVRGRAFYLVILVSGAFGIAFDLLNLNPMKALFYSAIVNGMLAPFLLLGILLIVRDRNIMRGRTLSPLRQGILFVTMIFMFACSIAMIVL